jgi:hypothetical protein
MVAFMDPKKSTIDIAQAIGRAMRKPRGSSSKKIGYIFIPLLVKSTNGKMTESSIEETDYKAIADVINAMQELDEDLKDIISEIRYQTGLTGQFNPRKLSEKISFSGNLNELSLKVIEKAVLNDVVDRIGESWDESFGKLQAYVKKHQAYPSAASGSLGIWVSHQRTAYNKKTLSSDRVQRLESLPGWSWDPFTDEWNQNFTLLKQYIAKHQAYPVRRSGSLGIWVTVQRRAYNKKTLSSDRVKRLESLKGWSWDPFTDEWNQNFTLLQHYVAKHQAYPVQKSGSLGIWVTNQRIAYNKKTLSPDRVQRLESLPGWSWDPLVDEWNKNFTLLKQYIAKHQAYPGQKSGSLGIWVIRQRRAYIKKTLSPDRVQRLESLKGWSWDPLVDEWNKNFTLLKQYIAKHQAYPGQKSGSLGGWVTKQRSAYNKKTLSSDRVKRLESLKGWSWDPLVDEWNQNFTLLKQYIAKHQAYPGQKSGSLGEWILTQRRAYKKKTLSPDRVKRLQSLKGWSWGRKKKN